MNAKNRPRQRLKIIILAGVVLCFAAALSAYGLRSYTTYFHSPSNLLANPPQPQQYLRIGGMVVENSTRETNNTPPVHIFALSDGQAQITVHYQGMLPDLFREKQGIVVEGTLPDPAKPFVATRVLAKHDEYYMPREIERTLKKPVQ